MEMARMRISALGGHILDGIDYGLFFSYHLTDDLCTLTYILWASVNTRNFKVTDVGNIQDSYQQGSQKIFVSQMVSNWMPCFLMRKYKHQWCISFIFCISRSLANFCLTSLPVLVFHACIRTNNSMILELLLGNGAQLKIQRQYP